MGHDFRGRSKSRPVLRRRPGARDGRTQRHRDAATDIRPPHNRERETTEPAGLVDAIATVFADTRAVAAVGDDADGNGTGQVPICHTVPPEDKTLHVALSAVPGHLAHGDYRGPCRERSDGSGNQRPTAAFTFSPEDPARGQTVTFNASSATDPDGEVTDYRWDLDGDGGYEATGLEAIHTYFLSGRKRVTLKVQDDDGATDTTTGYVNVRDEVKLDLDETAIKHKLEAHRILNQSTYRGLEDENFTGKIQQTFQYFIHPNRVTNHSVFELEQEVAGPMQTRNTSVTSELAAADRILAFVAIRDAKRAKQVLDNRSVDYDEQAVEKYLREAEKHFERGLRFRSGPQSVVAEISQYKESWNASQDALDILDWALTPQITLTSRTDPSHKDAINYSVSGRVFDVRPYTIDELTVSVNGEVRTADLFATTEPAANGSFSTSVRLDTQINRVELEATDDFNNTGRATLLLDGDRLPDRYEQNVTETDPLDPDSNSNATARDEADNGTRDDKEDFDGDRLATITERRLGTHPINEDTDGDGLSDGYEVRVTATDPLNADSDGDGLVDGQEDPDGDGLVNEEEQVAETNPAQADSDGDQLDDPRELELGTDTWNDDTDNDGLEDGTELQPAFNTDPLDPDTDDDGVKDGQETYTTTTQTPDGNVTVTVTGEGNAADRVSIEEPSNVIFGEYQLDAAVSETHDINVSGPISQASISLKYNASAVQNESNLSIYRYNGTSEEYERLDSVVKPAVDRVVASVSEFSQFTVFSDGRYFARRNYARDFYDRLEELRRTECSSGGPALNMSDYTSTLLPDVEPAEPRDPDAIVVGYNVSGTGWVVSREPFGGNDDVSDDIYRITGRINGQYHWLGKYSNETPKPVREEALITPRQEAFHLVTRWRFGMDWGYINPLAGKHPDVDRFAIDNEDNTGVLDPTDRWVRMIFFTPDGFFDYAIVSQEPDGDVEWLREDGSVSRSQVLHDFGFEARVAYENWRESLGGGGLSGCPDDDEDSIPDIFENIDDRTTLRGVPLSNGPIISMNESNKDTDEDGIVDNREIKWQDRKETGVGWISNPSDNHTDNDGIPDDVEREGWRVNYTEGSFNGHPGRLRWNESAPNSFLAQSDPKLEDTDNDGLTDDTEKYETHTHPNDDDTYLITSIQQREIVDRFYELYKAPWVDNSSLWRAANASWIYPGLRRNPHVDADIDSLRDFQNVTLSDASTDFDFVRADDGGIVFRSYASGATASVNRSDTWLAYPGETQLNRSWNEPHWDPDIDDDGLTDGQEQRGVTRSDTLEPLGGGVSKFNTGLLGLQNDTAHTHRTNPLNPDTDGDGYWDGWIGVYGVGRSDNVIQYMENLRDGGNDGVAGEEIVQEQAGIHSVDGSDARAAATSTRIFKANDTEYHSNLHIGELQWETDPQDNSTAETPDLSFTVEVDYYDAPNATYLDTSTWRNNIERNLAIYGFDVILNRDDLVSQQDIENRFQLSTPEPPFNDTEIGKIETGDLFLNNGFRDEGEDSWMFVTNLSEAGVNKWGITGSSDSPTPQPDATAIYGEPAILRATVADTIEDNLGDNISEARNATRIAGALHEIGHVIDSGEADERTGVDEVYSGDPNDFTDENIPLINGTTSGWSIMRSGWQDDVLVPAFGTQTPARNEVLRRRFVRYAISIEETTTVTNKKVID